MTAYIVCRKKRNAPRVHVRVCREKCPYKNSCKDYLATAKPRPGISTVHVRHEPPSAAVHPP
jgi:hypothetical protein